MSVIRDIFYFSKLYAKNKAIEFQIGYHAWQSYWGFDGSIYLFSDNKYFGFYLNVCGFKINLSWTHRCDHAGLNFEIAIPCLIIEFTQYDTRHWNYDNDAWEEHEE
jgi:hypothetical protein